MMSYFAGVRGLCSIPRGGGRGGATEFLYSNCGCDNRSRQTVVSLCHSNSSPMFCAELSYIHSQVLDWTSINERGAQM